MPWNMSWNQLHSVSKYELLAFIYESLLWSHHRLELRGFHRYKFRNVSPKVRFQWGKFNAYWYRTAIHGRNLLTPSLWEKGAMCHSIKSFSCRCIIELPFPNNQNIIAKSEPRIWRCIVNRDLRTNGYSYTNRRWQEKLYSWQNSWKGSSWDILELDTVLTE